MTTTRIRFLAAMFSILPLLHGADATDDQRALDSFKALVRRHLASYQTGGREHVTKLGGGWAKESFTLDQSSTKFDVEKTSSLVSPFVGTLTFTLARSLTTFHETEAEAAADNTYVKQDTSIHKHVFAFQDQKWQPTSRLYREPNSRIDNSSYYPCDEFLAKRGKPSERDIHGCLEEFDADK